MANPALGAKQLCPNCSAKFYDLNKRPAHCPKCAHEFDPEELLRTRKVRIRSVAPEAETEDEDKADQVVEDADELEEEEDETAELDAAADEPVSGDDDDAVESDQAIGGDDLGVDFAEDEDLAEEEADDVPFLEDEDDDGFSEDEIDGLPDEGVEDR